MDASPLQGYPSNKFAGTQFYTRVERGTVRVVSFPITQHNVPAQCLNLESRALTMRPLHLHRNGCFYHSVHLLKFVHLANMVDIDNHSFHVSVGLKILLHFSLNTEHKPVWLLVQFNGEIIMLTRSETEYNFTSCQWIHFTATFTVSTDGTNHNLSDESYLFMNWYIGHECLSSR